MARTSAKALALAHARRVAPAPATPHATRVKAAAMAVVMPVVMPVVMLAVVSVLRTPTNGAENRVALKTTGINLCF